MTTTHIALVLDRSGSMGGTEEATIGAINTYLTEAKADEALRSARIDLIIFDNQSIDTIRSGSVDEVGLLTQGDFEPRGLTPLYDAIARGIDAIDASIKSKTVDRGILVVMTDGAENASRKHSHSSICELIKAKQAAGWLIVFLGADPTVAQQGTAMGVHAGLVATMSFDEKSMRSAVRGLAWRSSGYAVSNDAGAYAASASFTDAERKAMSPGGGVGMGKTSTLRQPSTVQTGIPLAASCVVAGDAWDNKGSDADAWGSTS